MRGPDQTSRYRIVTLLVWTGLAALLFSATAGVNRPALATPTEGGPERVRARHNKADRSEPLAGPQAAKRGAGPGEGWRLR